MLVCEVRFPFHSRTILELVGYSRAISMLLLCWRNALSYHMFFFFLVLMHDKHFCTRWQNLTPAIFFLTLYSFELWNLHGICKWQKACSFHYFTFTSFLGLKLEADKASRSWTKIKLNLLNCSCIACKTLMVGIGTKTTFFAKWNFKDLSLCKLNNQSQSTCLGSQPRSQ